MAELIASRLVTVTNPSRPVQYSRLPTMLVTGMISNNHNL